MTPQTMHGVMLFTVAFAFLGQLGKSHPDIKNWIPQVGMVLAGLIFYAGNYGLPHSDAPTFVGWFGAISDWTEAAALQAAAIPGTASLFGLIPGMKTRTNP